MVPFARDEQFVGRSHILDQLNEAFTGHDTHTGVALYGLEASGTNILPCHLCSDLTTYRKTQIAIEYVYILRSKYPETAVFWVYASSEQRFCESFRDIAESFSISMEEEPDKRLASVRDHLCNAENSGSWLMVLGNVDDAELLFRPDPETGSRLVDYIPRKNANGHLVLTTRDKKAGLDLTGHTKVIEVTAMNTQEAHDLMVSRLPLRLATDDMEELLGTLDLLPLAIRQATAFMAENSTNTSQFLRMFRQEAKEFLTEEYHDLRVGSGKPTAVYNSWLITFNNLRAQNPDAADLLQLMSFYDRQGIPDTLLQEPYQSLLAFHRNIGALLRTGLVFTDETHDLFHMHALVRLAVRLWLEQTGKELEIAENALSPTGQLIGGLQTKLSKLVYPHALTLISEQSQYMSVDTHLPRADLLSNLAFEMAYLDGKAAGMYLREAVDIYRRTLGEHDENTLKKELFLSFLDKTATEDSQRRIISLLEVKGLSRNAESLPFFLVLTLIESKIPEKQREAEVMLRSIIDDNKTGDGGNYFGYHLCNLVRDQGKHEEAEVVTRETLSRMTARGDYRSFLSLWFQKDVGASTV